MFNYEGPNAERLMNSLAADRDEFREQLEVLTSAIERMTNGECRDQLYGDWPRCSELPDGSHMPEEEWCAGCKLQMANWRLEESQKQLLDYVEASLYCPCGDVGYYDDEGKYKSGSFHAENCPTLWALRKRGKEYEWDLF